MAARESQFTTRIINSLNKTEGVRAIKKHGSAYSQRGTPDIMAAVNGRLVVVEVKVGRNRVTAQQAYELRKWQDAGVIALIVRDDMTPDDAAKFIVSQANGAGAATRPSRVFSLADVIADAL